MGSFSQDFPFGILDVVELLHLHIRRRQADSAYTDCPFCGDRRGKMNVNFVKNVWRCNYCGEHGGMLNLYARVNNTTNSEAYREICDALQAGDTSWGYGGAESADAYAGVPAREPHAGRQPDGTVFWGISQGIVQKDGQDLLQALPIPVYPGQGGLGKF